MTMHPEFIEHILELFAGQGQVTARRMFGGHGIFRDGLMFGLVAEDTLYLKVDDENRAEYEQLGLAPFTYRKKTGAASLSYYQAPEPCLEEADEMIVWADKAYAAALRAGKKNRNKS